MLAWQAHQAKYCRCGHLKARAWHPDNEGGWFKAQEPVTCHACTALEEAKAEERGDDVGSVKPVRYFGVVDERDYTENPLPPLDALPAELVPPGLAAELLA